MPERYSRRLQNHGHQQRFPIDAEHGRAPLPL